MQRALRITLLLIVITQSAGLFAHHGVAAYDYSKTIVADKATVTEFEWMNPHCRILFNVTDDTHTIQHWAIEMHPPANMLEHGWTRQSLQSGDVISVTFRPAKDGSHTGLLGEVTLPSGIQLRQNLLELPPGQILTVQEWAKQHRNQTSAGKPSSAR